MATLSTAAKNAALDAVVLHLNTGGAFATPLLFLFSAAPASLVTAAAANWAAASGGQAALSAPVTLTQATNTGTAVSLFIAGRSGSTVITCTVGGPSSGADVEITPSAAIATGTRVRLLSLTLSMA